eukprot:8700686-Ditylum_brightwellii.AAC.1
MVQPTASIAVPMSLPLPTHPRFGMLELAGHQHPTKQAVILLGMLPSRTCKGHTLLPLIPKEDNAASFLALYAGSHSP